MAAAQQKAWGTKRFTHYIGGRWALSASAETIPIVNPATEETIALVPRATPAEAVRAIEAARAAFDNGPWPRLTAKERSAALMRFAQALERRREDLVDIIIRECGALVGLSKGVQVGSAIQMAWWYAERAATFPMSEDIQVSGPPLDTASPRQRVHLVQRVPRGVVTAITPFNYPFHMNVLKVFPALAVGCTIVLKPTPTTCLDAVILAEAAEEAGLPEGALNVLLGGGADVGEAMASHPMVDMVTFTGSTTTGRRIMEIASRSVKRLTLELGGKSPNIIFADADLEKLMLTDPAVPRNCGQSCTLLSRVLVEAPVYDEVVQRMKARVGRVVIGPPDDPKTELGPLVNKSQYDRVTEYIRIGLQEGAKLLCGGKRPAHLKQGYYLEPTIFVDVLNRMRVAQEEIFGPVLAVIKFSGEEEAVRIANDSIYGINAAVWTEDHAKALRVAGQVLAGNVGVNCMADITEGPHGGFKQTGIGREYRDWSLHEFIEPKAYTYYVGT